MNHERDCLNDLVLNTMSRLDSMKEDLRAVQGVLEDDMVLLDGNSEAQFYNEPDMSVTGKSLVYGSYRIWIDKRTGKLKYHKND